MALFGREEFYEEKSDGFGRKFNDGRIGAERLCDPARDRFAY